MNRKTSYKRKLQLLWIGAAAFAVLAYFLAVRNTVNLASEVREAEQMIEQARNAPRKLEVLESRLSCLNQQMGKYASGVNQDQILASVATFCADHNLILASFPAGTETVRGDLNMITYKVTVQGKFNDLMQLAYMLEKDGSKGHVSSLQFQVVEDVRSKRSYLMASIYLQNIVKHVS
ncbi:MAG: hypothetical protein KDD36_01480 [Flavobacteriales bacterium]|nr:hypothetical protein [Flavobacteriales bacterium]